MNERIFLTTEDYDNIWLRVKEKGIRWVLTWVTFIVTIITIIIATITFLGFNNYVQEKALSLTRVYVSSQEFKKEASDSLSSYLIFNQDKIGQLRAQLKQISDSIRLVSNISVAPYQIFSDGASFVDSTDTQFQIEYGNGESDKAITFKRDFLETPLVYFSPTKQMTTAMQPQTAKQSSKTSTIYPISLDSASRTGFTVKLDARNASWGFSGTQNFNWIAIGR
jgi:hypothetical protein